MGREDDDWRARATENVKIKDGMTCLFCLLYSSMHYFVLRAWNFGCGNIN
jgi:hypothetical protein